MSRPSQLYLLSRWEQIVACNLPNLSSCQVHVLAMWTLGATLLEACLLNQVTQLWAEMLHKSPNTVRQQLREFYCPAQRKNGRQRKEIDVTLCFAPLLRWVLSLWHGDRLFLALDATTLEDRFAVLAVCVIWGKCAIPVAWKILPGNKKKAWKGEWLKLLPLLKSAVPETMTTVVAADRGLWAPWLYQAIREQGWHPFLRINTNGTFKPEGGNEFKSLSILCPKGSAQAYIGTAFKSIRLNCTLLTEWKAGYKDPWLILTDLPPSSANVSWYRYRCWIEQCFKVLKSAGWQWESSKITECDRAERMWLVMAVSTLWTLSLGTTEEEIARFDSEWNLEDEMACHPSNRLPFVRSFRLGRIKVLANLLTKWEIQFGELYPTYWEPTPAEQVAREEKARKKSAEKAPKAKT